MRLNRRLALFLLLLFAAGVLGLQRSRVQPADHWVHGVLNEVLRPLEWGVVGVHDRIAAAWQWSVGLFTRNRENEELRGRVADLERALLAREEDRLENERLRRLLALPPVADVRALPAHVIGSDPTNWFRTIRIDRGLQDGVRLDAPVVADGGVVGHVIEVTPRRATVLLLLDSNSRVAAILEDSREQGLVEGRHAADLRMTYVDHRTTVRTGEAVITSGMGGLYPKGLLLGYVDGVKRVENEIFLIMSVRPSVDFARLEDVVVLLSPEATAADGDLATS